MTSDVAEEFDQTRAFLECLNGIRKNLSYERCHLPAPG
jgi:hypothetical protein